MRGNKDGSRKGSPAIDYFRSVKGFAGRERRPNKEIGEELYVKRLQEKIYTNTKRYNFW
jgi:hypothetical protein